MKTPTCLLLAFLLAGAAFAAEPTPPPSAPTPAVRPGKITWEDRGKAAGVGERPGEGPNVFRWQGKYWMLVDIWKGLGVYRSDETSGIGRPALR